MRHNGNDELSDESIRAESDIQEEASWPGRWKQRSVICKPQPLAPSSQSPAGEQERQHIGLFGNLLAESSPEAVP